MYENYCEYDDETNLILNCIDYIKGKILDASQETLILKSQKPKLVQNHQTHLVISGPKKFSSDCLSKSWNHG